MTASVAMEDDELVITLDDVGKDWRRTVNIEIELLRVLTHLRTSRSLVCGNQVIFRRDMSTAADCEAAKEVLRGFCLWGQS